ncbi:uncharacterized protein METZ01_LOCUS71274 [marine metagenome]|uniref:Uncharacterized protein n=1 Tax=marine metagenome TaxID=408172 RepID=A0A381TQV8_9ZZZZ
MRTSWFHSNQADQFFITSKIEEFQPNPETLRLKAPYENTIYVE